MLNKSQCVQIYEDALSVLSSRTSEVSAYEKIRTPLDSTCWEQPLRATKLSNIQVLDWVVQLLMQPLEPGDEEFVEAALSLLNALKTPKETDIMVLCKLILEDHHERHEDIAQSLQYYADSSTVNCLYEAAQRKTEYYDVPENPFARKCLWALGDINTEESWEKIQLLGKSNDETVSQWAIEQLERRYR